MPCSSLIGQSGLHEHTEEIRINIPVLHSQVNTIRVIDISIELNLVKIPKFSIQSLDQKTGTGSSFVISR